MTDSADFPLWVYGCAIMWLLYSLWRGWSLGVVRQAVALVALLVSVVLGYWAGPLVGMVVPAIGFPAFLRPLAGGLLVGGLIWLLINICSAIVFRKTSDQGFGPVRLVFGGLGACLGLVSGAVVLGLGAWAVRWSGSVAEGVHASLSARKKPGKTAHASEPEDLLLTLKKALDHSSAGSALTLLDPVTPDKYRLLTKIGQVAANPAALERLMAQPNLQPLVDNANIRAVRDDQGLRDAIADGDLLAVLANPRVAALARDSQVIHVLRHLQLEKVLTEALAAPSAQGTDSLKPVTAPEKKRIPPR